ncbi:MAG: dihydrofolate reductase family protein [Patescibacteria group bacterium]
MKKLIMWNVITIDGYFQGVEPWDLNFHTSVYGDELEQFSIEQLDSAEAIIYGSVTYAGMALYWKNETGPVADRVNTMKKYVCTRTLTTADWTNTEILNDAVEDINKLKLEGEGNLFVFGSGKLCNSLIKAGLFDEYRLCIAPMILGNGRQLFEEGLPMETLELTSNETLKMGGVMVRYGVRG